MVELKATVLDRQRLIRSPLALVALRLTTVYNDLNLNNLLLTDVTQSNMASITNIH
jgi:hypothetical protein